MDIIGLGFDATDIPRVAEVFERTATDSCAGSSPTARLPLYAAARSRADLAGGSPRRKPR